MASKLKKKKTGTSKKKSNQSSVASKTVQRKKTSRSFVTTKSALQKIKNKIRRKQYSRESLNQALECVEKGKFSYRKAASTFGVPLTTVYRIIKNPDAIRAKPGPSSVLTEAEEKRIVHWLISRQEAGFPVTKVELLDNIQLYVVNRKNPFTLNRPGRHWYESFRRRNPEVVIRKAQNLNSERLVSEEELRNWFAEMGPYLESKGLKDIHPTRVFNTDETGILFCPTVDKVFARRGSQTVYQVFDGLEHERLTVLFTYSASGAEAPPMIIFKYKEDIPEKSISNIPGHWGVGISETGWMTGELFYEYITNVFYKWLLKEGIQFPIVIFLDSHSSHLTIPLIEFAREHKMEFINFVPHSTHIMQPLDTSFFHTLKETWIKELNKLKREKRVRKITNETFSIVLVRALKSITKIDVIMKNGFKSCGLLPFDPNAIDYNCLKKSRKKKKSSPLKVSTEISNQHEDEIQLKSFEKKLAPSLLKQFLEAQVSRTWVGAIENKGLFEFWLNLKSGVPGMIFYDSN